MKLTDPFSMDNIHIHTFPNGITIVHREVTHTRVLHCGFVLDIGSRDEAEPQEGLAHFWEHMAFKGTSKRKSFHIINRLEAVGGELNAYTTKEKIWFHASVLDQHFERALELLKDITFNSVFPEKEIEKEKNVILEEMSMYLDSPEDAIQDDFEALLFREHPLAHNILGTQKSVSSFRQKNFKEFLRENMDNERLIFSSIGNIPFAKIKQACEKHLSEIPVHKSKKKRSRISEMKSLSEVVLKPISQAHCMMGRAGYSVKDKKRVPLFMLTNLLGGPAMTSRLNMTLRERKGLVYSIDASYTPLTDTGLFSIYFGTEKKQVEHSLELIRKEFKLLRDTKLGDVQLHSLKEQIKGQLAIAEENNINFMQMMGRSLLDSGKIESLEEVIRSVEEVSAETLRNLANEFLKESKFTSLTFLPEL
ncbi:MAG TPA: pitrilysin family protein [Cytophagaceae bacterium]|nr:pitrilysin family protein [Cytophagaceae bacterium]